MADIDVLIVGSGPTGLMLALELAVQNISFRIIDSSPTRDNKSRAFVFQARTLELINRHGIVDKFIERGKLNLAVRLYANKKFFFENDFSAIKFDGAIYQVPLIISQAEIERIFDELLLKWNVKVERPVKAEKILQDDDGATAILRHEDGSQENFRCKYVVGCDGSHSVVRSCAGLSFEGAAYPQDFLLADVHMQWVSRECLHIFMAGATFMLIFPMGNNTWRLVCPRSEGLNIENEPTLEDFQDMINRLAPEAPKLYDPIWISRFRLHHRIASSYRAGRMFLAGDAAHIHSPAGGQGMNTGIQDAVNLGWKLATVLRGEKSDSLLDSYTIERRRVGETLLQGTDRLFEYTSTTQPLLLFLRNYILPHLMPLAMKIPGRRERAYRYVSQLGIRYRHSPIVGQTSTWVGKVKGGDRLPDGIVLKAQKETSIYSLLGAKDHTLLIFCVVNESATLSEIEKVESIFFKHGGEPGFVHRIGGSPVDAMETTDSEGKLAKVFGFKSPGFVLSRPDTHVAFIGGFDIVDEFDNWMGKRS